MTKPNAILLHGTEETPNHYWLPQVREHLEQKGIDVWSPQLPDAANPSIDTWLPFIMDQAQFTEHTILIGRSSSATLAASLLARVPCKIKQAILVCGWYESIGVYDDILEDFDTGAIKQNCADLIYVNSDNDPWQCHDEQAKRMAQKTGGTLVVPIGQGHFGSESMPTDHDYQTFPLLLNLLSI